MKYIYQSNLFKYMDRLVYEFVRLNYRDFILLKGNKNDVHTDEHVLKLDISKNYDIVDGFGTYQDWKKYKAIIRENLVFKKKIRYEAQKIYASLPHTKKIVAMHFRRTDYLVLSSLNLTFDYYKKAMGFFNNDNVTFLVFSDDIESCKEFDIFKTVDTIFVSTHSAGVDMCLMSLCDHNIIANSTFSFWGAFLGMEKNRKVICPYSFIGERNNNSYINGNYYPENWIAI